MALTYELNKVIKNAIEDYDRESLDLINRNIGEMTGRLSEVKHFAEFECYEQLDNEEYFCMLQEAFQSLWWPCMNEEPLITGNYELKRGA